MTFRFPQLLHTGVTAINCKLSNLTTIRPQRFAGLMRNHV